MTGRDPGEHRDAAGPALRYMPGLDGLRGLAVVAVVIFHSGHLRGGYLGVDLFFVLSGFLITSLLIGEGSSGRVRLGRFWGRRARRLLPALGMALLGIAAYARFAARPEELGQLRWDGIATIGYVMNWREIFGGTSYWDLFSAPSVFNHTWSLAIEEQFYLIWPFVFVGMLAYLRRSRRGRSLAQVATFVSATLAVVSLGWTVFCQSRWGWNRVYMGTDTRAFALLCGATLAGLTAWVGDAGDERRDARRALDVAGFVAAGVLAVAWATMTGGDRVATHGGLAWCSVAATVVVAAVANPHRGPLSHAIGVAPLRWLGLISYGVYLYHWPIFVWLNASRVGVDGWALFAVQAAVTLVVAIVSYFLLEQPIRHGHRWSPRGQLGVAFGSFAAILVLVVASTAGAPSATRRLVQEGERSGERLMITGNSVAWYLARDGVEELHSDPQFSMLDLSRPGCVYPPESGSDDNGRPKVSCDVGWVDEARDFRPTVVLYTRDAFGTTEIERDGEMIPVCSDEFRDWYADLLRRDIISYRVDGATLGLVTSLPVGSRGWGQVVPGQSHRTLGCTNAVLHEVAAEFPDDVVLIDLYAHLCDDVDSCAEDLDGVELRSDGIHFRDEGAVVIAQWILAELGIDTHRG